MRVLWFSVSPISLEEDNNKGKNGVGWIHSLLLIASKIENLEIGIVYANYLADRKDNEIQGNIRIFPINVNRNSVRQKLRDAITYKVIDELLIRESLRIIHDYKPSLIQVFGSEWCFGLLSEYIDIPIIIHMQGFWPQIRNARKLIWKFLFLNELRSGLLFHPITLLVDNVFSHFLSRERQEREQKILHINHFFMCRTRWDKAIVRLYNENAQIFHVDEALRPEFLLNQRKWKHGNDNIVLITTGICSYKGTDVALKAAQLICENTKYKVVWKWIGGDNKNLRPFELLTGIKGKDVGIVMKGRLNATQILEELLTSEIYVHLSYTDNSPNAVCEAQYLGMPVIATNVGGIPSLFDEEYDKDLLVPINDPYYLASKIVHLYENIDEQNRLSDLNWNISHKRHAEQNIMKQLMQAYLDVINYAKV